MRFDESAAGPNKLVQSGSSSCASQTRHEDSVASQSAALRHPKMQCNASVWQRCVAEGFGRCASSRSMVNELEDRGAAGRMDGEADGAEREDRLIFFLLALQRCWLLV